MNVNVETVRYEGGTKRSVGIETRYYVRVDASEDEVPNAVKETEFSPEVEGFTLEQATPACSPYISFWCFDMGTARSYADLFAEELSK